MSQVHKASVSDGLAALVRVQFDLRFRVCEVCIHTILTHILTNHHTHIPSVMHIYIHTLSLTYICIYIFTHSHLHIYVCIYIHTLSLAVDLVTSSSGNLIKLAKMATWFRAG